MAAGWRTWAVAVSLALVLLPSAAARAADVAVVNERLVFKGGGEVSDLVDVEPVGLWHQVYSDRDRLEAGPGCFNQTERLVVCPATVMGIDVDAGRGNDLIGLWDVTVPVRADGGTGDDFLEGGRAPDSLEGGQGDDGLTGGAGDDGLTGGDGDDVAFGGDGADTSRGSDGDDVLGGDTGADVVLGGRGRDLLRGGVGDDRLDGDRGDDAVVGGPGKDMIEGGPGEDDIFGSDGRRDDFDCGRGDRVDADPGERPSRCGKLPGDAAAPRAWPPQPAASGSLAARAARLPAADPRPRAFIRRPGRASRTTVCVRGRYYRPVRVRVRPYTVRRRALRPFRVIAAVKTCKSVGRPRPDRRAVYAKARLAR